ncbi:Transcriptional regulatory protein dep1 [Pleurostoma richardsiae]|uniref:Transcriptional regulatory protein dep1 n=1 Tax=Pleurostoma richardsiae TaxID=41990 RepID=A0AA38RCU3_9PEZI|nr:Transcriptional regulatory protein dep1 [Pleurostoma richardsiae]
MASGGSAAPVALANQSQSLLDHNDSAVSSPLSDVDDKDGDTDDMDLDFKSSLHVKAPDPDHDNEHADSPSHSASAADDDDDSNLSEVDINDSEAETERLFDSPKKPRDTVLISTSPTNSKTSNSRDRPFERSPSKLQYQVEAPPGAKNYNSEDDANSETAEPEDHESDAASVNSSEAVEVLLNVSRSVEQQDKTTMESNGVAAQAAKASSPSESRKRKRSSQSEKPELDQTMRKRTGSIAALDHETPTTDNTRAGDEHMTSSTNNNSGEQSAEDDAHEDEVEDKAQDVADATADTEAGGRRSSKSKRSSAKKRKDPESDEAQADEEMPDAAPEQVQDAATGEEAQVEDEHAEPEVDEEAEAAHRNEEELEKKRAAFEQLAGIEKHFAAFRDRLYEERLAQLEQEEAMLRGDNPTHPEYLAMMQCIDERRDEKMRTHELEYKYNTDAMQRWAVARRTQILTQFYQGVRESRVKILEELGQQWYEIQQERRRHANSVPDYGIRFPTSKTEQKKQAVAYNKEVSILSGIARHKGFPAAPEMKGASAGDIEDDLDAINRARQASQQAAATIQPPFQDYGGLSFGRSLGPAGEQFLEQTPWANPNHPSHQIQRQSQQEPFAGPSGTRRTPLPQSAPHPHGNNSGSTGSMANGASRSQKGRANVAEQEMTKVSKMPPELRPEAVAQSS